MSDNIKQLLKQLHDIVPKIHHPLLKQLTDEIALIKPGITAQKEKISPSLPTLDNKSGCYTLENSTAYYCPNCYEAHTQLIKTQRLNSKLRVCPQCRSSIKAKTNTSI